MAVACKAAETAMKEAAAVLVASCDAKELTEKLIPEMEFDETTRFAKLIQFFGLKPELDLDEKIQDCKLLCPHTHPCHPISKESSCSTRVCDGWDAQISTFT